MRIDTTTEPYRLLPDTGMLLQETNPQDTASPYTTDILYIPSFLTLEMCKEQYVEIPITEKKEVD